MANITKNRLDWVDHAKGLGIILVVFGHVMKGLMPVNLVDPQFYYYSVNFVYSFHMPLFFILSGYFFLNSFIKRGVKYNLLNKVETVAYPFVIWSLIQTLIEAILSKYTNTHVKMTELITCLYMPRSQFWFLFALFFINLLCMLFFSMPKKIGFGISVLVWVLFYLLPFKGTVFDKTFVNLIYFVTGIAMSQYAYFTDNILSNNKVFFANLLLFAVSLYVYFVFPKDDWYNQIFPQLLGSLVVIRISDLFAGKPSFSIFKYLGINSLAIYLLHLLVGNGMRIVMFKFLHITNSPVHILVGTISGIIVPVLVYNIAVKTQYLKWLFFYPRR